MKWKYAFLFCLLSHLAWGQPFSESVPYNILYGDWLWRDLNQQPLLASMKQELANSDLLGNLPSFDLFKKDTNQRTYPNGNRLLSFDINNPDLPDGIQYIYYENGNIMARIPFKNNLKSGTLRIYYPNAVLFAEIPYQADQMNGTLQTYYPMGTLKMEQPFENNRPVQTGKMFHSDGSLQLEQSYENGFANGAQTQYYNDGVTVQSVIPYKEGWIDGTVWLYYPDSTPLAEVTYQNKSIISNKCWTSVGQVSELNQIGIYQLENGIRPIQCPYQNIQLSPNEQ